MRASKNIGCYMSRLGYEGCDGMLDAAHWVPKQRIKQVLKRRDFTAQQIAAISWDPRVTAPVCRHHHTLFDNKSIRLKEADYPPNFREWAKEYAFEFRGERDGWVGIHVGSGPAAA